MSKSLIKLVDEAILPAFLIIGVKVLAISLINDILSLSFFYQNLGKLFYTHTVDALTVNSWSDFAVYLVILLGVIFILIKLLYFTDNKTEPAIILKLSKANKLSFIQTSIEIYHILFVWLIYLIGLAIYLFVRAYAGVDTWGIAIIALATMLTVMWIVIKEVEKDIIKKLEFGKHNLV